MSTFGEMKTQINDELQRDNTPAQVAGAIGRAVQYYERQRFTWNVRRTTTPTVSGVEYFNLPPDYIEADILTLLDGDEIVAMDEVAYRQIEEEKDWTSYISRPYKWAVQANEIRLYPVPDQSYTLRLTYVYKLPEIHASASDAATNAWTTEAEEMIRLHAKTDILENNIRGEEAFQEAARLRLRELDIFKQLRKKFKRSQSSGHISPWI